VNVKKAAMTRSGKLAQPLKMVPRFQQIGSENLARQVHNWL
jgi:hypothetical protein